MQMQATVVSLKLSKWERDRIPFLLLLTVLIGTLGYPHNRKTEYVYKTKTSDH